MANTPEATQYYHDLDEGQLLRIRKHALVDRFGKYPENKDGVQYDDGTGEVILSNGQNVPPDLIEFKDSSGNWRSVSDAARFMPKETEGKDLQQSDLSGWEPGSLGGVKPPNPMQPSDSPQEKPLTRVGGPGKAFTERWDNAVTVDNSDASPQDQRLFMVTVVKPNGDPLEESFFVKALTRESARAGLKNTRSRIASVYRGKAEAMISEVEPDAGEPVDWGALRAAINQG